MRLAATAALSFVLCLAHLNAQEAMDPSQMGFSQLQKAANTRIEDGDLEAAAPLLEELIKRVEAGGEDAGEIKLDTPLFVMGTAQINTYLRTGNKSALNESLEWYGKLEERYPDSPLVKDALLKKVDLYRVLDRNEEALETMRRLLQPPLERQLNFSERSKVLKDLAQTYYLQRKYEAGIPYFALLLRDGTSAADRALGAAALFEARVETGDLDAAVDLLPELARESEMRFRPRLNVAMLQASDKLVEADRILEASILLNLIRTTDRMVAYHEEKLEALKADLQLKKDLKRPANETDPIEREIAVLENNLKELEQLPPLRDDLLVRRARNYTKMERNFEAFWMFLDLKEENPESEQIEFYTYAAFSNARTLGKDDRVVSLGREYIGRFSTGGDYYSDVAVALAQAYLKTGEREPFHALAVPFLDERPNDPYAGNMMAMWGNAMMEEERFEEVVAQTRRWQDRHDYPIFEDGLFYWQGMAQMQLAEFTAAADNFAEVADRYSPPRRGGFAEMVEDFAQSYYREDALLRLGIAAYYGQDFTRAESAFERFRSEYPNSNYIDQALYFLGEVAFMGERYDRALGFYEDAAEATKDPAVRDTVTFRIADVLEALERYEAMTAHLEDYIARYGEEGRIAEAVLRLGRSFELRLMPTRMLALYREHIRDFAPDPGKPGVDALIESYAEKYATNREMLEATASLFERLETDEAFRASFTGDRGFLFEYFYENETVDQRLYNRLRTSAFFNEQLAAEPGPLLALAEHYRTELTAYPEESPETFFGRLAGRFREDASRLGEARMLMGMYRIGVEREPSFAYDSAFLAEASPRVLLYIADYSRLDDLPFAIETWTFLIDEFPRDDTAIVAHLRLADVRAEAGEPEAALQHLETVVTQFPGSPKLPGAILRQGDILTAMGDYEAAREKYQYLLRVPEWRGEIHARALLQTGLSYEAAGRLAEAHGFLERTFIGYPHLSEWAAQAYLADARVLFAMNQPQDAKQTLTEALESESLSQSAPDELMQSIREELEALQ